MMLTDAIRDASTVHEICFLLTAYIDAARYGDQLVRLPDEMRNLPINGREDLRIRIGKLKTAFGASPEELADKDRVIVKEALDIFSCALGRLSYLAEAEQETLAQAA
jgi:hypothetical protein